MMKNKNQRTPDIMSEEHVSNNIPSKQESNKEINTVNYFC